MIANHIHDALNQVGKLRNLILEKKNFKGYSGKARIIGGFIALLGAVTIYAFKIPDEPLHHLMVWCGVLLVSLVVNYGGLAVWFFIDPEIKRNFSKLIPAIDAIPALAVGGFLTVALPYHNQFELLMPMWMCLYGLVHIPYRLNLPKSNYYVGIFYILCGGVLLFFPQPFTNPWPMGIVFCIGETAGGISLWLDKSPDSKLNKEDKS
jgi:hypothetical protein